MYYYFSSGPSSSDPGYTLANDHNLVTVPVRAAEHCPNGAAEALKTGTKDSALLTMNVEVNAKRPLHQALHPLVAWPRLSSWCTSVIDQSPQETETRPPSVQRPRSRKWTLSTSIFAPRPAENDAKAFYPSGPYTHDIHNKAVD